MLKHLPKILTVLFLGYGLIYGMTADVPLLKGLGESTRCLFYHVPMWFAVIFMMGVSVVQSIFFLRMSDPDYEGEKNLLLADAKASSAARIGVIFNLLGLTTGIVWSRVTWGENLPASDLAAWWVWDPIQICALISLLIYGAYFLLRRSFGEPEARGRVSAVYNIFAFVTLIPLYFIAPKMFSGLHPTSADSDAGGGSFIFSAGGVATIHRLILYPTMIGFLALGWWLYELRTRLTMQEEE